MNQYKALGLVLAISAWFSTAVIAQRGDFLSRTAVELGFGYQLPTAPTATIEAKDFAGFQSYYAGMRYEWQELWGLRGIYAYQAFKHKGDSKRGLTIHKLTAAATFNVIRSIQQQPSTPFEIIAHAGLGLSLGKSAAHSGSDMMGHIQGGLMPKYDITSQLSMHLDAVYTLNLNQDYGYQGAPAQSSGKSTSGGYFTANLGVAYKLN